MPKSIVHQYWFCNPIVWTRLLIQNRGVSPKYLLSALIISIISIVSFPFQILNYCIYWAKSRRTKADLQDPVFIIGHWRGGTTLLHYLMAQDQQFGFLTYYHAFLPNLAFVGGSFLKRVLEKIIPSKRPQDNIHLAMDLPTEEENPLSTYSLYSASHSFFFPKNEDYFEKFAVFSKTTGVEKVRWQKAYRSMLRRICVHQNGKRILIKNPHNTGRIKELLEIFPKAKFIHIYRNPYDVFPSTYLMYDLVVRTQFLQPFSDKNIEDKILNYYTSIMGRYIDSKQSVPKSQLIEVRFEEFEKNPIQGITNIYRQLNLDMTDGTIKSMEKLVATNTSYKKNKHSLDPRLQNLISEKWHLGFEEFGYQKSNP